MEQKTKLNSASEMTSPYNVCATDLKGSCGTDGSKYDTKDDIYDPVAGSL